MSVSILILILIGLSPKTSQRE